MKPLPPEDLQAIVDAVDWSDLKDARILLTGGTGYLMEDIVWGSLTTNSQPSIYSDQNAFFR